MKSGYIVFRTALLAVLIAQVSACSFAPVVAQKLGVGTVDEKEIADATAKVFAVNTSDVNITDIRKDNTLNGTQVFFAATVRGKAYRCGMLSSFAGATLPKCVKPGEPLPALQ